MNTLTAWRMAICYSPSSEPQKETFLKSQGTNHHWLTLTVQDTRQLEEGWGKWLNEWTGKGRAVLPAAGAACKAIFRHSGGPLIAPEGFQQWGPVSVVAPPRPWVDSGRPGRSHHPHVCLRGGGGGGGGGGHRAFLHLQKNCTAQNNTTLSYSVPRIQEQPASYSPPPVIFKLAILIAISFFTTFNLHDVFHVH